MLLPWSGLLCLLSLVSLGIATSFGDKQYALSTNFQIHDRPQVRRYHFTLTNETGPSGPDGYRRSVIAINGQMPGPVIEANSRDTIVVTLHNRLSEATSIHWHGLYQNGTNWEDGVSGVTQCPIAPGQSYTYTFQPNGQFGTYWYHSHSKLQMADGLFGPMIIHSVDDPLVRGRDFDKEIVVMLSDWFHKFETDGHLLDLVEVDGTGIAGPKQVERVTVAAGQRSSVILKTTEAEAGTAFWIRGVMDSSCWAWVAGNLNTTALGVVRVRDRRGRPNRDLPTTQDWPSANAVPSPYRGGCVDLKAETMVPLIKENVPAVVSGRGRFATGFVRTVSPPRFAVNGISYLARPWQPLNQKLLAGGPGLDPTQVALVTYPTADWYDLILINTDPFAHPYHLHAMDMHIVYEGRGNPTDATLDGLTYNLINPLRRDTISIPGNSFVVARLNADIPGVWLMHCHIGWHLSHGFAAAVIVQPDVIKTFNIPKRNLDLCKAAPANSSEPEPGRRVKREATMPVERFFHHHGSARRAN